MIAPRRIAPALGLALALSSAPRAEAYESKCYEYPDPTLDPRALADATPTPCSPEAGPNAARNRWVGPLDEHRQLFVTALGLAGLDPLHESLRAARPLRVYTSAAPLTVDGAALTSLVPARLREAERVQLRYFAPEEFAQLPDFSYALWDWSSGNETCPVDPSISADDCHSFTRHMGAYNSNHFLPQAGSFFALYHNLALDRARECGALHARLGTDAPRFREYEIACEEEALTLEAVAQHFLQDAWSAGHMWERWGGPNPADFPAADQRARALLVASTSGIIHGSRGVLQEVLDESINDTAAQAALCAGMYVGVFVSLSPALRILASIPGYLCGAHLEVNDPLCYPAATNEYVVPEAAGGATRERGGGDDFLASLPPRQQQRLNRCAAASIRAVYDATGQAHGAPNPVDPSDLAIDPTAPICLGQRVTNRSFELGMGIGLDDSSGDARAIPDVPMDPWLISHALPRLLRSEAEVDVPPALVEAYRADLVNLVLQAAAATEADPNGTQMASGEWLPPLLGVAPNHAYDRPASSLATYQDPPLPWRETESSSPSDAEARGATLARVFHRAHAQSWCEAMTEAELTRLHARAGYTTLDADAQRAACEVCTEFALRHLRVGTDASHYDTTAEPLCDRLGSSVYVYQPTLAGNADPSTLAHAWCDCADSSPTSGHGAFVLTAAGLTKVALDGGSVTRRPIGATGGAVLPLGESPRAMATYARAGFYAAVTDFRGGTLSIVSLLEGREAEVDVDADPMTTTAGAPAGISRIAVGPSPRGVAVTPDGRFAFVAISASDEVVVVDLDRRAVCKRISVGVDPSANEVPDDVAFTRNGLRAYVSLAGSPSAPGQRVAVIDTAFATDCADTDAVPVRYLTDLGGSPQPGAMSVSPDGALLAIAGRGNNLVILNSISRDAAYDVYPSDPSRRWPDTAPSPWALAWGRESDRLFIGSIGGASGSRLSGYGVVRIRRTSESATGAPLRYDVGVQGAVRAVTASDDGAWVYVGDDLGNLTALDVALWDGAPAHYVPGTTDSTGGCLNASMRYAVPCPATLALGAGVRAIVRY